MKIMESIRSGHPATLFSAFLYFDVSFMAWVILGPLAVYIASDFGLSTTEKGLMVALPILGGAILRIPMGILTDQIGPKRTGLIGLSLTMIPLLWGWLWADSLGQIMVMGLLLGVAGASFAVALPLASRWYPKEHQGMALGIAGAGNSGTVLAALFAPRLAEIVGWHGVMGLAIIPVLATIVLFWVLAKESPSQPKPRPLRDYVAVQSQGDAWWFNLFYAMSFGGFVGLASFLAIFFYDQYDMSRVMAGTYTAGCVFAGSFFRPVGGILADRFGGPKVLSILFASTGLIMLGVSLLPSLGVILLLIFTGMMCLGMGNGAVFQMVPQRFGKEIGVITGLVGAAGAFGGFLLPTILGALRDLTGDYQTGFIVFGLLVLSGALLLQLIYQRSWRWSWMVVPRPSLGLSPGGRVAMEVVFGG